MLEVSWGELAVVTGLGMFLVGRKDLPAAARTVGTQLGRVVGLLQGARARADRFAANHELKQLQNELRAGLRELDAVKSEMAISMSPSRGMVGRELGATVPSANRSLNTSNSVASNSGGLGNNLSSMAAMQTGVAATTPQNPGAPPPAGSARVQLPPERQTVAAVAEEEWRRQGIGFSSRAEQGHGGNVDVSKSGSAILSSILQESLIFSQYDRVVQEQEQALQSKVDGIIQKNQQRKDQPEKQK